MATYIPGMTDYVPQFQPFQPDYNFLGNMLQNAQSKYDSNYNQLNQTYGTLLNSPMLRQDNLQQRDEFFKMIDQDIKKISGMDLSLQQNVDSANKVFDSFYQNKEMVKDMVYTKEYQKQLEIGENYRNCIDQDKCGGKYWDTGAQALHYKADEFKKANRQDTLAMSPGRFVPMINVDEKAMKYATDLLGKGGWAGVQAMTKSPDGRYNITLKNGKLLEIPLQQLLLSQYGKDQNIIDMYTTNAYVQRKGFVSQNTQRFGSEDAAENEYFRLADEHVSSVKAAVKEAQDLKNATNVKRQLVEQKIKTEGSTGHDDIADLFAAASVDDVAADEALKYHQENDKIADSIFEAGDNRNVRRQRVDALFARSLMNKEIANSATYVAALTGSEQYEADPYAKSYYDFSLDMAKQKDLYERMGEHEMYKATLDMAKQQALKEYEKRGAATGPQNEPTFVPDFPGTTTGDLNIENKEIRDFITQKSVNEQGSTEKYVSGYAATLMSIMNDPNAANNDKLAAGHAMNATFGTALYDDNGKLLKEGWDKTKKTFVDKRGNEYTDPQLYLKGRSDWRTLFDKAKLQNKNWGDLSDAQGAYLKGEGAKYIKAYEIEQEQQTAATNLFKANNNNVKEFAMTRRGEYLGSKIDGIPESDYWNTFFTTDGRIKSEAEFKADFIKTQKSKFKAPHYETGRYKEAQPQLVGGYNENDAAAIADKLYKKYDEVYTKVYNDGNAQGLDPNTKQKVPLVRALASNAAFQNFSGGKTSGAAVFETNSLYPASLAVRGTLTFANDVIANESSSMFVNGLANNTLDAKGNPSEDAKMAFNAYVEDVKAGRISEEDMGTTGQTAYMDVALGSPDYVGVNIRPSQKWIDSKKSKDKDAPNWADKITPEGFSVYTPKATAANDFTTAFKTQPYDMILNHQSKTITYPEGGSITINKRAPDGSFTVTGSTFAYVNGERVSVPLNNKIYPAGTSGQNIVVGIDTWLKKINDVNSMPAGDVNRQNLIFDPRQLPEIQRGLNQRAGDDDIGDRDLNEMFRSKLQLSATQMQNLNQ